MHTIGKNLFQLFFKITIGREGKDGEENSGFKRTEIK